MLGLIDPREFADGRVSLDVEAAKKALLADVGQPLALDEFEAARGVLRTVDENMANAARIHAVENGKDYRQRTMVAFGGNGPLHATGVAERIGVVEVIVPLNPSVGSAIGFLAAPVSYEIVRSLYTQLDSIDIAVVNRLLEQMRSEPLRGAAAGGGRSASRHTNGFHALQGPRP